MRKRGNERESVSVNHSINQTRHSCLKLKQVRNFCHSECHSCVNLFQSIFLFIISENFEGTSGCNRSRISETAAFKLEWSSSGSIGSRSKAIIYLNLVWRGILN